MTNLTDDRTLCCSNTCEKRFECGRNDINNVGTYCVEDFSSFGNGTFTDNGCKIDHWCGKLGYYKMFEPIENKENTQINKVLKDNYTMDFYTAWRFLEEHKIFNGLFGNGLWIDVVKVNPVTNMIDDDTNKNTKVQIWLEHGEYDEKYGSTTHNIDLDCGGDTFEEAIIELVRLVKKYYTDDGERINS